MAYWPNVLNYDKTKLYILCLKSRLTRAELEYIKNHPYHEYIFFDFRHRLNFSHVLYKQEDFSPQGLKNINFCLTDDSNIEERGFLLASGISIIHNFEQIKTQDSLERINNFEKAKDLLDEAIK